MPKPAVPMVDHDPEAIERSDPVFTVRPGMTADAMWAGIAQAAAAVGALGCRPCAVDGGPGTA